METELKNLPGISAETRGGAEMAVRRVGAWDRVAALVALRRVLSGIDTAADVVARMQAGARRPD